MQNRALPPIEWDHDKSCYAEAVISAVQNLRDCEDFSRHDFALAVQGGGYEFDISRVAHGYLNDGLQDCRCERTCPAGLNPWDCRPASTCEICTAVLVIESGGSYSHEGYRISDVLDHGHLHVYKGHVVPEYVGATQHSDTLAMVIEAFKIIEEVAA